MQPNRRDFFRQVGCLTAAGSGLAMTGSAGASQSTSDPSNSIGVLGSSEIHHEDEASFPVVEVSVPLNKPVFAFLMPLLDRLLVA